MGGDKGLRGDEFGDRAVVMPATTSEGKASLCRGEEMSLVGDLEGSAGSSSESDSSSHFPGCCSAPWAWPFWYGAALGRG